MIDGIFRLTFPLSYPLLLLSLTIVFCIIVVCLGTFSSLCFLLLVQCGLLRLKPITDLLHAICIHISPDLPEKITANLRESFPVKVTGTLPSKGIYLFHPHGLITLSHMINIGLKYVSNWPVKEIRGTALHSLWYSFGVREVLGECFIPSNYTDMKKVIDDNMSLSVSLGGMDEMRYLFKDKIRVKIKSRKGVFRLAIETGTPLVPVLAYGENESCDNWGNWEGFDWINKGLRSFHSHLIIPSWELYEKYLSIHRKPFDVPVVTVIGEPVAVGPAREPTDEDIRVVRSIYIQRLRKFYRETRPANYAEELEVV